MRSGFLAAVGLVILFAAAKPVMFDTLDPDCFWHLRVGEQLCRDGVGPLHDQLSFSSQSTPWTPYSWLAEIGMYKLWSIGGFRAAVLATSLLVAGYFTFIAMSCRELVASRPNRAFATVLATTFAAILSLPYLSFRPVTAVIFLLAINGWLLLRDRRLMERSRAVWWIAPITLLAANMHLFAGMTPVWCLAFLMGAVIERLKRGHIPPSPLYSGERAGVRGGFPVERHSNKSQSYPIRRYTLLTVLTLFASLATPMLPGLIRTAVHYTFHDPMVASPIIAEFRPIGPLALILVAILAVCVLRQRHLLRPGEWICLAIASILLLKFGRFAPPFAIIAAPVFAVTLPTLSDNILSRRPVRFALFAVLSLATFRLITTFPRRGTTVETWINRHGPETPGYPTESAQFVATHIPASHARLINEFTWGGYLEWKLGPRFQTLLDGRTQVFPPEFWQHTYLTNPPARKQFLAATPADVAIVPVDKSLFKDSLIELGWTVIHTDDRAQVLLPPNAHLELTE